MPSGSGTGILPEKILRHAGFVMAHAAAIASVLRPGELICPFAVLTKGKSRQSIEFEAATQDEAVCQGWDSLEKYKQHFDMWAFAREGTAKRGDDKEDVLVVAAWANGMLKPVVFTQGFVPTNKGGFALVGPLSIFGTEHNGDLERVKQMFDRGVAEHPKGNCWASWYRD